MEELMQHKEAVIAGIALIGELLLRMLPGAWPFTRIIYEGLGKIISDKQ